MAKPHRALVDLVAARDPAINALSGPLVESAVEHRVPGLLHSWAEGRGLITGMWGDTLTALDANIWARNRMLTSLAERVRTTAETLDIPVAFIKGVALEALAYDRMGERPSGDLDVVLPPGTGTEVVGLVEKLQPDHPWLPHLDRLVSGGYVQSVDLVVGGIPVDLHLDALKLEVAALRQADRLWDRLITIRVEGIPIPTFDPEASLALALLHLNKDRFSHLIAYADVIRLWDRVENWDWIEEFARSEGIVTPLRETAVVALADLDLTDRVVPLSPGSGSRLWRMMWPERLRLSGAVGRVRWRYRQMFIPILGGGRVGEVTAAWMRRIFPPREVLQIHYPVSRGPYLWRLLTARISRRIQRREIRKALAAQSQSSPEVPSSDLRA